MALSEAHERFSAIAATLDATPAAGAIWTGFAELVGDETGPELIARADSELVHNKRGG